MGLSVRHVPELVFTAFAVWCYWRLTGALIASQPGLPAPWLRFARFAGALWTAMPLPLAVPGVRFLAGNPQWLEWARGLALGWGILAVTLWALSPLLANSRTGSAAFDPARRRLLRRSATLLAAAPAAGTAFGILVGRNELGLTEVEARIEGLPRDLEGLRLVQLSDIHLGAFLDRRQLRRAVELANATRAHLALVTGDLITLRDDFLLECLEELARLRAEAGVLGCLGNHEQTAGCEQRAKREGARLGIEFLRRESRRLRFGSATLWVSGVDFRRRSRDYMRETAPLVQPGEVNLLLSHNPDAFPAAASHGYHLTLAGHTHGGQLAVPGFEQRLNPARILTPYVYGLYREGRSLLFVSRGIGTVAVPARLGAPPEVALIRLCAT
jgi:predicted MPP superfamily phosphohydrolase